MVSPQVLAAIAGVSVATLYILYRFDQNRRSDPQYRQKLIEKRRAAKKAALHAHSHSHGDESQFNLPQSGDLNDSKRFYTTHMQMADQAMASKDYERAAKHFAAATAVTERPDLLLAQLSQLFPEPFYHMIINELRKYATASKEQESGIEELE